MNRAPRYGILGGTFDPIHLGHLIAAQAARNALGLDRVIFIPAGQPPHKKGRRISPAWQRLRMAQLAVRGNNAFEVSNLEMGTGGPSYTIETLRRFKERHPGVIFYLLMGWDQAVLLDTWRSPEMLFRLARVAVMERPGFSHKAIADKWGRRLIKVEIPQIEISSSLIRRMVRRGMEIKYLVPGAVEAFILRHGLYR